MSNTQGQEVFRDSSHRGSQIIELPPITIELPLQSTFVLATLNLEFSERYYTVMFGGNKILRTLLIYATDKLNHVDIAAAGWGQLEGDQGERVAKILGPVFPQRGTTYLCKRSRQPTHIGALLNANNTYFLFAFRVFGGALKSQNIIKELSNSINVKLL
jgi:hypothetical protein